MVPFFPAHYDNIINVEDEHVSNDVKAIARPTVMVESDDEDNGFQKPLFLFGRLSCQNQVENFSSGTFLALLCTWSWQTKVLQKKLSTWSWKDNLPNRNKRLLKSIVFIIWFNHHSWRCYCFDVVINMFVLHINTAGRQRRNCSIYKNVFSYIFIVQVYSDFPNAQLVKLACTIFICVQLFFLILF